jgi:hypothetical protein
MHRDVDESWLSQVLQYLRANPDVLRAASSGSRQAQAPLAQSKGAGGGEERALALLSEGAEREAG